MHFRLFICGLLLCLFANRVNAQELFQGRKYGISFSAPVFSFMHSNDRYIQNRGVNMGYGLQAHVEFPLSSYVSISTGLGYGYSVGGRIEHTIGGNLLPKAKLRNPDLNSGDKPLPDGTRIRYKLQVLDVPVGVKFYTPYKNNRQYFVELPIVRMGLRLKANGDIELPDGLISRGEKITNETWLLIVSAGMALGMVQDLGPVALEIAFTGQYWISDLTRNHGIRVLEGEGGVQVPVDILSTDRPSLIGLRLGLFF